MAVTDDFNRADASPIGGNWTTGPGFTGLRVVSNECAKIDSFAGEAAAYYNAASFADNQYSQYTPTVLGTNTDQGPIVRCATSGTTKNCYVANTYITDEQIFKFVGGTYTKLLSVTTSDVVNTDVIRVEAEGSTIRWVKNGTSQGSVTDSSLTSGAAGIFIYRPDCRADNWEAGDIGGAVVSTNRRVAALIPGPGPYNPAQFMRRRGSTAISVTGDMAGTSDIVFSQTAALTGTGALAGNIQATFGQSAALTGAGQLSGNAGITFGQSAVIVGSGALSGAGNIVFGQSAAMTGSGQLAGSTPLTFSNTGTLVNLPAGAMNGIASVSFGLSGILTGAGAISGDASLSFDLSGALSDVSAPAAVTETTVGGWEYYVRRKAFKRKKRELEEHQEQIEAYQRALDLAQEKLAQEEAARKAAQQADQRKKLIRLESAIGKQQAKISMIEEKLAALRVLAYMEAEKFHVEQQQLRRQWRRRQAAALLLMSAA